MGTNTTIALNATAATVSTPGQCRTCSPHDPRVLRQTQAVIGVMLLASASASYFVDSAWLAIPAFIGVALLVAGATGVCPMALVLARMPWNRAA